jgi:hypothetical protein
MVESKTAFAAAWWFATALRAVVQAAGSAGLLPQHAMHWPAAALNQPAAAAAATAAAASDGLPTLCCTAEFAYCMRLI